MHWNMNCTVTVRDLIASQIVSRIQKTAKAVAALGRLCFPCSRCGTQ